MSKLHARDNAAFKFARRVGKKRAAPKDKTPEAEIQELTEKYLNLLGIPFIHIPAFLLNAAFSMRGNIPGNVLGAMRNAAQDVRGFPDLVCFDRRSQKFLALELKSALGKMTANQEMWSAWLGTIECRSFEQAKQAIDAWRAEQIGAPPGKGE